LEFHSGAEAGRGDGLGGRGPSDRPQGRRGPSSKMQIREGKGDY